MDQKGQVLPVPAVFEGNGKNPYTIRAARPGETPNTDLHNRIMAVPVGDSPQDLGVRQHEMLHAALSPAETNLDNALLAAEDGRVESIATAAGIKRESPITQREMGKIFRTLIKNGDPNIRYAAIAITGAPAEPYARKILKAAGKDEVLAIMDEAAAAYAADPSFQSTHKVAGILRGPVTSTSPRGQGMAPGALPGHQPPKPKRNEPEIVLPHDSEAKPDIEALKERMKHPPKKQPPITWAEKNRMTDKYSVRSAPQNYGQPPADPQPRANEDGIVGIDMPALTISPPYGHGEGGGGDWAKVIFQAPPRIIYVYPPGGAKPRTGVEEGTVPVYPERAVTDGMIFKGGHGRKVGTVLVDMSGSMSFTPEQMKSIVEKVPAAVIAGYFGCAGWGILRILAANGKMILPELLKPTCGGNEIDGPAIEWLAHQRGPRVWVSDGNVVASGDYPKKFLLEKLIAILAQARIRQIDPQDRDTNLVPDIVAALNGRRIPPQDEGKVRDYRV